jgi:hypothetical protein
MPQSRRQHFEKMLADLLGRCEGRLNRVALFDCIPANNTLADSLRDANAAIASSVHSLASVDDEYPRFIFEQTGYRLSGKACHLSYFSNGEYEFIFQLRFGATYFGLTHAALGILG